MDYTLDEENAAAAYYDNEEDYYCCTVHSITVSWKPDEEGQASAGRGGLLNDDLHSFA